MRVAALCASIVIITAVEANAQEVGGYITAGSGSIDYLVHRETIPQISGGVLWRIGDDRVRLGGEVEALTSNGYWAGKGGPFGEVTFLRRRGLTPFVRAGRFYGEDTSWIVGAGVDLWVNERGGLRVVVQDAFRQSTVSSIYGRSSTTFHEPSFQIGWTWK